MEFPKEVALLLNLVELKLRNNQLQQLPEVCVSMKKLRTLNISGNFLKLIPDLPSSYSSCELIVSSICDLNVSNNPSISFPKDFLHWKSLAVLSMVNCKLESIPNDLYQLANLEQINLQENRISVFLPGNYAMPNLQSLRLDNNQLTDFGTTSSVKIGDKLPKLNELFISFNKIKSFSGDFHTLTKLSQLQATSNGISSLEPLIGLTAMEQLYLSENRIKFEFFFQIFRFLKNDS